MGVPAEAKAAPMRAAFVAGTGHDVTCLEVQAFWKPVLLSRDFPKLGDPNIDPKIL